MKLKNSYILLIAMAIFLLVSMGSVCASDIADDSVGSADDVILGNENATGNTIEKIDTSIVSENTKYKDTDIKRINVAVKDNESNPIGITKKNITVTEKNQNIKFNYVNSKYIIVVDKLDAGKHNLVVTYLGNDIYKKSTKNIVLSIYGDYAIDTSSSVNVNSSGIVTLPIKITNGLDSKSNLKSDDFEVSITYDSGNGINKVNVDEVTYKNGKLTFDSKMPGSFTSSNITVTYKGENTLNKTITLKKEHLIKVIPVISEAYYGEGNFTFKIIDSTTNEALANKTVSISGNRNGTSLMWTKININNSTSIGASITVTTNEEGIAVLPNKNFETGYIFSSLFYPSASDKYVFVVKGVDDLVGEGKVNAKIKKAETKITVKKFNEKYGTTKSVEIVVVNKKTNQPLYGIPVTFKVTNSTGGEVGYSTSNGTKINVLYTNQNGTISLPMANLIPDKYTVEASVNDSDSFSKSSVKDTATVEKRAVEITGNVVAKLYYGSNNLATLVIKDKETGAAVPNAIVLFQVYTGSKYENYLAQANEKGIITPFKVPIDVGTHKMVISMADPRYTGSPLTKSVTVVKASAKFVAPQVNTYYKHERYFNIQVINTKNNQPVYGAKVNLNIYTSSTSYYKLSGTTGADGYLKYAIDLAPGTHKVVVMCGDSKNYAASQLTSKIVVYKAPTKLTPTEVTAKKGTNSYLKIVAKNTKTNKIISGLKLQVKVYTGNTYKTYTVTTNANGIANFNVKVLSVGTHKVVVSSANSYCVADSVTSTIKITN